MLKALLTLVFSLVFIANAIPLSESYSDTQNTIDISSTNASPTILNWNGYGTLIKTGHGTGALNRVALPLGKIFLQSGSLDFTTSYGQPADFPLSINPNGQTILATNNIITCTETNHAAFKKMGAETLTIDGIPDTITKVEIQEGTLRFAPSRKATFPEIHATVPNPSFESHDPITVQHKVGLPTEGWTLTQVGANGKCGICINHDTEIWTKKGTIPDGTAALFMQFNAKASTTVTIPTSGVYRLSFFASGRYERGITNYTNPYCQQTLRISLDGETIGSVKTAEPSFQSFSLLTPPLLSGDHTLQFEGLNENINRASIIDCVSLTLAAPQRQNAINLLNGSFEDCERMESDEGNPTTYRFHPQTAKWTFDATNSGLFEVATPRMTGLRDWAESVPEGRKAAFFRNCGTISQTVALPDTNGVYRLEYALGRRMNNNATLVNVYLDDEMICEGIRVTNHTFIAYQNTFSANGRKAITIRFTTARKDMCNALLDDVRLVQVDEIPIENNSLEDELPIDAMGSNAHTSLVGEFAGWNFQGKGDARSGITTNSPYFGHPFQGRAALFISGKAYVTKEITIPQPGLYELAFWTRARYDRENEQHLLLYWGNEKLGDIRTQNRRIWKRQTFLLKVTEANTTQTLRIEGCNPIPNCSIVDELRITRLANTIQENPVTINPTVEMALAEGTELNLNFDGERTIRQFNYGERLLSGSINQTTYPEFISGEGSLFAPPHATLLFLR